MDYPPKTVVIDWINTIWETDLPPYSKYLACYLRKFMNSKHDMAWPSYSRIIHETGLSRMTVSRYLGKLEQEGWIIRSRGRKGKNTEYTACFPSSITERLANNSGSTSQVLSSTSQILSSTSQVHELNNNKQRINKDALFGELWLSFDVEYGEKGSKKKAFDQFKKIPQDTAITLRDVLQNQLRAKKAQANSGEFFPNFPHVERWLRDRRYEDEITTTRLTEEHFV